MRFKARIQNPLRLPVEHFSEPRQAITVAFPYTTSPQANFTKGAMYLQVGSMTRIRICNFCVILGTIDDRPAECKERDSRVSFRIELLECAVDCRIFQVVRNRCQPHPSIFSAEINASCGISTFPNWRIFFLPAFCLSRSLRFRVASPP